VWAADDTIQWLGVVQRWLYAEEDQWWLCMPQLLFPIWCAFLPLLSGFLFILADNLSLRDFLRADFVVLCAEQV
jgi:hypothetical protein